jgi:hypothetical protein
LFTPIFYVVCRSLGTRGKSDRNSVRPASEAPGEPGAIESIGAAPDGEGQAEQTP